MFENKFSAHYISTSRGSYQLKKGLTREEFQEIANDEDLSVIGIDSLAKSEFVDLENLIFSKRPNVLLYKTVKLLPEPVNLNFLNYLPSLKRLRICEATSLSDFKQIELMSGLEELSFYRCEPKLLDILKLLKPNLRKLSIEDCLSKGYTIDFITRFQNLQTLKVEGPCKGIEEIGKLLHLEELVLRSISLPNLDFIMNLKKLWSITFILGGIKDFTALYKLPQIKYLQLSQVKGLSDVSFISKMTELQNLFLESQIGIKELPSFDELKKLRRIGLMNLEGLKHFQSLKSAPNLQHFFFTGIHQQLPEDLVPVLQNASLTNVYVHFPSEKKNKAFDVLVKTYRKQNGRLPEFTYNG